ncbi:GNAT family N-acetyltransferase [Pseudalkalibacillus berkeleyi]|uniref:GNAT family N-acetyltransferase n=1 Tax=Pseudalkalibacillus berkeleyi TaxID=1069813 RepID=A0ABS9GYA1_9BACL|nr:GNAT family N-acetyltransferase [Pseudalkalibacillus berkeleyi]MCF6137742.1 GNAT family N-acetyltransferase [Pseudalkalibacillus berkeleyi]
MTKKRVCEESDMGQNEILALFHKELRQEAEIPGYTKVETPHTVRHVSKFGEKGFVSASNLNKENARKIINEEIDYFAKHNQDFEFKVYSYDRPDNLKDILVQEGFTIDDPEALMVMEIDERHPLIRTDRHPLLKEITDEQGIQDIIQLEDTVWNVLHAELGERLWRDKQDHPDDLFLYGIYDDELLVSGAWMYVEMNSSFCSLWGGSTLADHRKKGYYTALLAERAKKAFQIGHPYLTVDASPMSKPILEKSGFQCLAYSYGCQSPPIKK